jgi:EAL domain-containing protein (putative c-di-GMP-specific phosphodiesterase class I)/GGDEF domain-containing protein
MDVNGGESLESILEDQRLTPVFQPIIRLSDRRFIGYEGLIRGPEHSDLRFPDALFARARESGRLFELERVAREATVREFVVQELNGSLFLNCSPEALTHPDLHRQLLERAWPDVDLDPERVVIEVTEVGSIELDERFDAIVEQIKNSGYRVAIDDIGAGFGNAVLWDRMRPDIIKTDGRFASKQGSAFQRAFIKHLFALASEFGVDVIAEGIDSEQALQTLHDVGIDHAQGFFIDRPVERPGPDPASRLLAHLPARSRPAPGPADTHAQPAIESIITQVEPIPASTLNHDVARRFENDERVLVLPVTTDDGRPLGIVHRYRFLNAFSKLYSRELYGRKPCTLLMQDVPLTVDAATPLNEVAASLPVDADSDLLAGVIVTRDDRYVGLVTLQQLIGAISELQVASARHANPLTNLPGNVPINQRIDQMLASGTGFVACYIDIDRFKPFNDRYGFSAGDRLILALARSLERCAHDDDFVGHIGGDDFLALLVADDWYECLEAVLRQFDEDLALVCSADDLATGGFEGEDRQGERLFHELPTVSIGVVRADAEQFESHRDLSGSLVEAKKLAKQQPGHAIFVERRSPAG